MIQQSYSPFDFWHAFQQLFRVCKHFLSNFHIKNYEFIKKINFHNKNKVDSGLQSAINLHTVRLFTEGDDTRGCSSTIVLLKISWVLLETC